MSGLNSALVDAQPDGKFLAYSNYLDPELSSNEAARLYFGARTYNKLVEIKKIFDPNSVFWNPHAIGHKYLQDEVDYEGGIGGSSKQTALL